MRGAGQVYHNPVPPPTAATFSNNPFSNRPNKRFAVAAASATSSQPATGNQKLCLIKTALAVMGWRNTTPKAPSIMLEP